MSVTVDLSGLERMASEPEQRRRQEEFARRAALTMRQYVPVEEGALRASEPISSDYAAGLLVWGTPYAAKHYHVPMRHTASGTCDHWDEAMMRNDGPALLAYAETLYEGW